MAAMATDLMEPMSAEMVRAKQELVKDETLVLLFDLT